MDTGASISLVKYETVSQCGIPIQTEKLRITGIGGHTEALGFVYISFYIDGQEFVHKFYVLETLRCACSGIIGQDFLMKYDCVIDYEFKTLSLTGKEINNVTIPLQLPPNEQDSKIIIPSRCEKIFWVDTTESKECAVLAKELCKGVFLASSIANPRKGKIPVQIINTRDSDVCIYNFRPETQDLKGYDECVFEKDEKKPERIRKLLSQLNFEHLNAEERESLENICAKYCDVFYLDGDKLSVSNICKAEIKLKSDATPVYVKPYRFPHFQKKELEKQVRKMLDENIIEETRSNWSSPILLVPKKAEDNSKKWRLVIDFRKLNERILDDKFPLPNITDILDSLSGAMYFSHLDLSSGYYQLELEKESRKYTSITTPSGQYQMTRLPMGLKTSPSCFSRAMTIAMAGLNYEKCFIYLDDLICFGRTLDMHNKNLMDVLQRLRKVNLKLNPQK